MSDTKKLVLQILQADKPMQKMLFGYYKPRLSQDQIEFVYNKLEWLRPIVNPDDLIDYAEKTYGWRKVD